MKRPWLLVAVMTLTACSPGGSSGAVPSSTSTSQVIESTSSTTPPTTSAPGIDVITRGDLDIVAIPGPGDTYPADVFVSACDITFSFGALADVQPLEVADPGGISDAISPFLADQEGQQWPQEGWLLLSLTDNEAWIVNRQDPNTFASMRVEKKDGQWSWAGSSLGEAGCLIHFATPPEYNQVEWRLDDSAPEPTSESTVLDLLLHERECVDGREIGDRLVGPQIVMSQTQLMLAFAAQRPEGEFFTCPGNPDLAYRVELPVPLGDREIVVNSSLGIYLDDYLP